MSYSSTIRYRYNTQYPKSPGQLVASANSCCRHRIPTITCFSLRTNPHPLPQMSWNPPSPNSRWLQTISQMPRFSRSAEHLLAALTLPTRSKNFGTHSSLVEEVGGRTHNFLVQSVGKKFADTSRPARDPVLTPPVCYQPATVATPSTRLMGRSLVWPPLAVCWHQGGTSSAMSKSTWAGPIFFSHVPLTRPFLDLFLHVMYTSYWMKKDQRKSLRKYVIKQPYS